MTVVSRRDGELTVEGGTVEEIIQKIVFEEGCSILITPVTLADETVTISTRISYGDPERDNVVREAFDYAEWGNHPESFEQSLRFAAGNHYGSHEDFEDDEEG